MNKQDSNGVRTAQDIERKYDFSKMLGLSKNVELNEKSLVQIQNTLNEMLNSLVINLSDVLESQSDISLWFYSGIPDGTNAPYTSWTNPENHYGDFYYDTNEGKVYKFYEVSPYITGTYIYGVHGMWDAIADADLLRAMAITNSEIDTSVDHERKVFLQTPTTPYSSGDWWIKSDGSLFVCQLGRATGAFIETDFTDSINYAPTIAESFDDVIQVLKGTVTQLSEDCVRFTDLSTGGSTTIAGENIKTGNIESNNYVSNTSGMKINLTQGTIDTKNFKTDTQGNIYLGTGGKVIGGDGLLTNLQFGCELWGWNGANAFSGDNGGFVGYNYELEWNQITQQWDITIRDSYLNFCVHIPEGFTVSEAKLYLRHSPVDWTNEYNAHQAGSCKNMKLYKATGLGTTGHAGYHSEMVIGGTAPTLTLISSTPATYTFSDSVFEEKSFTIPASTFNTSGTHNIVVKTSDSTPTGVDDNNAYQKLGSQTGILTGVLEIIGYKSIS